MFRLILFNLMRHKCTILYTELPLIQTCTVLTCNYWVLAIHIIQCYYFIFVTFSGGLPFISSVDLVESSSPFKPGKELVTLFKDVPELRDILYCILIGRPFAIIANQRDEKYFNDYFVCECVYFCAGWLGDTSGHCGYL